MTRENIGADRARKFRQSHGNTTGLLRAGRHSTTRDGGVAVRDRRSPRVGRCRPTPRHARAHLLEGHRRWPDGASAMRHPRSRRNLPRRFLFPEPRDRLTRATFPSRPPGARPRWRGMRRGDARTRRSRLPRRHRGRFRLPRRRARHPPAHRVSGRRREAAPPRREHRRPRHLHARTRRRVTRSNPLTGRLRHPRRFRLPQGARRLTPRRREPLDRRRPRRREGVPRRRSRPNRPPGGCSPRGCPPSSRPRGCLREWRSASCTVPRPLRRSRPIRPRRRRCPRRDDHHRRRPRLDRHSDRDGRRAVSHAFGDRRSRRDRRGFPRSRPNERWRVRVRPRPRRWAVPRARFRSRRFFERTDVVGAFEFAAQLVHGARRGPSGDRRLDG